MEVYNAIEEGLLEENHFKKHRDACRQGKQAGKAGRRNRLLGSKKEKMNAIVPRGVGHIETLRACMEESIRRGLMVEYEPPVEWVWGDRLVSRRNVVPGGITVISRVHTEENLCVVLYGTCAVYDQDGRRTVVEGPTQFITYPGTLRAIHCITDTSWINVYARDGREGEEDFEALVFEDSYTDYMRRLEYTGG
jgi:hypothetical protein